jgi:hypothetical protein
METKKKANKRDFGYACVFSHGMMLKKIVEAIKLWSEAERDFKMKGKL